VPGGDPGVPGAGRSAASPPRPRAPWQKDEPAVRGAGWPADESPGAGWPSEHDAGAGWAEDEDAAAGWAADENSGEGWAADEQAGQQWPAGAPAGPGAGWREDQQPGWSPDELASPGGGWPASQAAGWPADQPAGPGAGWPSAQPAAWPANERSEPAGGLPQVAAPRSPSGTWPPPDQADRWSREQDWSAPDPSEWSAGSSDVLDPLPPGRGSRHRRPEPDDDEGTQAWPVPERDWRGDGR
jgi:hypothetical protein